MEYTSQMLEDHYKEVIAFANMDGNAIYIGIDDVDETYTKLTNEIRDAI